VCVFTKYSKYIKNVGIKLASTGSVTNTNPTIPIMYNIIRVCLIHRNGSSSGKSVTTLKLVLIFGTSPETLTKLAEVKKFAEDALQSITNPVQAKNVASPAEIIFHSFSNNQIKNIQK
jgi:hypothetical protein